MWERQKGCNLDKKKNHWKEGVKTGCLHLVELPQNGVLHTFDAEYVGAWRQHGTVKHQGQLGVLRAERVQLHRLIVLQDTRQKGKRFMADPCMQCLVRPTHDRISWDLEFISSLA